MFPSRRHAVNGATCRPCEQLPRVHLVPWFGDRDLRGIAAAQVEPLCADKLRRLSPKTVADMLGVLSSLLKAARRWGSLEHDPMRGVAVPKVPPPDLRFWDGGEAARLIAECARSEPDWVRFFETACGPSPGLASSARCAGDTCAATHSTSTCGDR